MPLSPHAKVGRSARSIPPSNELAPTQHVNTPPSTTLDKDWLRPPQIITIVSEIRVSQRTLPRQGSAGVSAIYKAMISLKCSERLFYGVLAPDTKSVLGRRLGNDKHLRPPSMGNETPRLTTDNYRNYSDLGFILTLPRLGS